MRAWLLAMIFVPAVISGPGNPDFKKIFGNDYVWAVNWLRQNDGIISAQAAAFSIETKVLKAIVFPELIRYNSLLNTMEIETLKYLYVQEGRHYANFSVGFFQMKPSFAEEVEQNARVLPPGIYTKFDWPQQAGDEIEDRKLRVKRLSNIRAQVDYLCAFYLICAKKFNVNAGSNKEEIVRLLATSYNAGFHHDLKTLKKYQDRKHFNGYNYSTISWYYYLNE